MQHSTVPLSVPYLSEKEKSYLEHCLTENWVSTAGPLIGKFEEAFARRLGVKHAIACASGTSALHLALLGLGFGENDLVFVSTLTFVASANAVTYVGAEPIFVDCCETSLQIDHNLITIFLENECIKRNNNYFHTKSGKKVRGIMPVHVLGHAVDMTPIMKIAKKYNLYVIEDAAEALGVMINGKPAGTIGDLGCFSFNGNKIITSGAGGMVSTNNSEVARKVKSLSEQSREKGNEYIHHDIGYNYRMSNLHAAIGLAQFENLDKFVKRKIEIAHLYQSAFASTRGLSWVKPLNNIRSTWWLFTIVVNSKKFGISARQLIKNLEVKRIESRPLWQPMHISRAYTGCMSLGGANAEVAFDECVSLPSSVGMTAEEQQRVITTVLASAKSEK